VLANVKALKIYVSSVVHRQEMKINAGMIQIKIRDVDRAMKSHLNVLFAHTCEYTNLALIDYKSVHFFNYR